MDMRAADRQLEQLQRDPLESMREFEDNLMQSGEHPSQQPAVVKLKEINTARRLVMGYMDKLKGQTKPTLIILPYVEIMNAFVNGEFESWSTVKRAVSVYYSTMVRTHAVKHKEFNGVVSYINALGVLHSEGNKVEAVELPEPYEMADIFQSMDCVGKTKLIKCAVNSGDITAYPIKAFPTEFKLNIAYPHLDEFSKAFRQEVIRNKINFYITDDFAYGVDKTVLEIPTLKVMLDDFAKEGYYQLTEDIKLHLIE